MDRPVAVVTGASSGFGAHIVRELAARDYMTVGVARREVRLGALAHEVGGDYAVCDITEPDQVAAATDEILHKYPEIQVLVNSAGMALRKRFEDATPEEVEAVMDTNYHGPFRLTRALQPGLEAAGSADVINIVSAAAGITNPNSGPYGASKQAQGVHSRSLAMALGKRGIRVHAVHPGKAHTDGHPQTSSSSPLSGILGTDVETVASAVVRRIGENPGEVYVPRILKFVATAEAIFPITVTRIVDKLIS